MSSIKNSPRTGIKTPVTGAFFCLGTYTGPMKPVILAVAPRPNRLTRRLHWWLLRWRTRNWYRMGAIVEDDQ